MLFNWLAKKKQRPIVSDPIPGLLNLHQAMEGVLIMGGTGSGKTTGPGAQMAVNLLQAGAGFLVLAVKPDEYARWKGYCQATGRECIRFAPGSGFCCDLLDYELSHGEATVEAAAGLLDILVEVSSRQSAGQGDERFWSLFAQKIFRRAIATIWYASGHCSLTSVYRLITSAPESLDQVQDAGWRQRSYCAESILKAAQRMAANPSITHEVNLCGDFWLTEWPNLSDKTRSVGYTMTTNVLDKFLSGPVMQMVSSGRSNLTPEHIMGGACVVADMSVLRWREPGQFFQIIFKTLVQRAVLRRDVSRSARPVVIWADEAQFFLLPEMDGMVQTVARQARLISVVLTQNLPTLYAAMGGSEKARHQVDGWFANHSTKIIGANSCKLTNEFWSEVFGSSRHMFFNGSTTMGDYSLVGDMFGDSGAKATGGFSEQWHPDVTPGAFTKLRKGGKENGFIVEAYLFQGGKRYPQNGNRTWVKTAFKQHLL